MRPLSIYFLSLIAIVVAFIARWLLDPVLGDHIPFATFFIAVAFAAWLGGLRPALLATGLGFVLAWYCFIPTRFSFELKELQHTIGLAVYLTVGFALAGFGEATRIAQARLADQKEQLRTTFASIGDGVISTDASGNVTYLNAVAESLTGWLSREAEGVPLTQVFRIVNESTRQEVENPAMRALQQGIIIGLANHTILIAKDGTERPIDDSASPIRNQDGVIVGCVLVFRDITERRQLERQNAERLHGAQLLSTIVDSSDDAIISKSLEGVIQSWNSGAERLFGYAAADAIGRHISLVIPADRLDEEELIMGRIRDGIPVENMDTVRMRSDGQPIHVSLSISPIRDEAGRICGVSKIARDITARKEAEQQLRESETRYRALAEASATIVWQTNPEGAVVFADHAWNAVTGQTEEQKRGWGWLDAIHPEDRNRTIALWKQSLESRTIHVNKFRVRTQTGDYRWFSVRGVPIFRADGSVRIWVGANTDIHDEMTSELALRESEARLRGILRQSPAGIVQTDPTGRMTMVNQRWCEMLGYSEAELLVKNVVDVTHPSFVLATTEAIASIAAGGPDFQIEKNYCRRDGSLLSAQSSVTAVKSPEGELLGLLAVVVDMTDRLRVERELREKTHFLERVAEITPGVLHVFDLVERRSVFINRAVMSVLGYSPEEVDALGTEVVPSLMHPEDLPRFEQHIASIRTLADGEIADFEFRMRNAADGWHWFHSHDTVFIRDATGTPCQLIGVATDISERKRNDEELRRLAKELSEADRRKDEFLATLAHELRNPLAPMRNGLQIMRLSGSNGEDIEEVRDIMERQLGQMVHLIDDLLDVSRISRGKLELRKERVNLATVLNNAIETSRTLIEGGDHQLTLVVPPEPIFIDADVTRLGQVFSNLLNNAAKYSERGGRIEVVARVEGQVASEERVESGEGQLAGENKVVSDEWREPHESTLQTNDCSLLPGEVVRFPNSLNCEHDEPEALADFLRRGSASASGSRSSGMGYDSNRTTSGTPGRGAGDEALGFQTAQPLNPQPPLPEDGARGSKSGDSLATPSATNHSPLVTVSVKDSGVGIPAEMLPKIFELFTQVDQSLEKSQGGLGIGLSLVKRLVEMHGGSVEARSEGRGKGSEFVVRLPVDMSNVETASQTNDVPAPIPSSKRRILVADDNKDAASTLAMMLKFLGNEVRTAHDGLQAVEVAEEFRPDVVLLDIGMPKLNGYEACRRMREQAWCKETFLIALTGWGQDEDKRRSQEAGFHQHWVKPVEPVALKKLLAGLETVGDVSP